MQILIRTLALGLCAAAAARAHDTWLQTNTPAVHPGDAIEIDLYLGNHGNNHRDFKVAGKADLAHSTVFVVEPDGKRLDLQGSFVDRGYMPKEGFWSARFEPTAPGLYLAAQASDQIVHYAPERVVRSAKTFFEVSASLDRVPPNLPGFDRVIGDPLELVALSNPIAPAGPGVPLQVRLLFHGKPLAGETVSFIPAGETLDPGFDPRYERRTDAAGAASFTPTEPGYYLIVAHREVAAPAGASYQTIKYSATMTVIVPALCPCCGD